MISITKIFLFLFLKNKRKIPLHDPEIEPQTPDSEQILETIPEYPTLQTPLIVCPFANVSFHFAFPSFDKYGQYSANYYFPFHSKKKKKKKKKNEKIKKQWKNQTSFTMTSNISRLTMTRIISFEPYWTNVIWFASI